MWWHCTRAKMPIKAFFTLAGKFWAISILLIANFMALVASSATDTVSVLVVPPNVRDAFYVQRGHNENRLHTDLRDWQEFLLLGCETCESKRGFHLEPLRCASITAMARLPEDPLNTYYSAYARWHREDCPAYQKVHPWSFLFCSVSCEHATGGTGRGTTPPADVRGSILFLKRQGGTPGTHGMHDVIKHPGRLVEMEEEDVKHLFAHAAKRHVRHGH